MGEGDAVARQDEPSASKHAPTTMAQTWAQAPPVAVSASPKESQPAAG